MNHLYMISNSSWTVFARTRSHLRKVVNHPLPPSRPQKKQANFASKWSKPSHKSVVSLIKTFNNLQLTELLIWSFVSIFSPESYTPENSWKPLVGQWALRNWPPPNPGIGGSCVKGAYCFPITWPKRTCGGVLDEPAIKRAVIYTPQKKTWNLKITPKWKGKTFEPKLHFWLPC